MIALEGRLGAQGEDAVGLTDLSPDRSGEGRRIERKPVDVHGFSLAGRFDLQKVLGVIPIGSIEIV
jgi:hypothetical protein